MRLIIILLLSTLFFSYCSKEKRSDKAGEKMQQFIIDISDYARQFKSDFIIIPQNGPELVYNYLAMEDGLSSSYMSAIDGVGIEELFYDGSYSPDNERISMLSDIVETKPVLVAEFVKDSANIADAIQKNEEKGFICFPRDVNNYDYTQIPDSVTHENDNNINTLADAQNYLYIIGSEEYSTKTEFLNAIAATNFDVVLMDLFFEDSPYTPEELALIKTKVNGGTRLLIAYMNIGAAESYRYYWKDNWKLHHPSWLKKPYDGYEDEIWVKFWKQDWQDIIYGNNDSYTKKIIDAGFDGAYLDNTEAYYFLYFD